MTAKSTGNCYLCGAELNKTAMKNHLINFHGIEKKGQECALIKAEGLFPKGYWIYIDVPLDKTLKDIDKFLRKIWLECCGHLSQFYREGLDMFKRQVRIGISFSNKINDFSVGDKLSHMYDFGTTTETVITFMGNIRREPQRKIVRLLARNIPPVFKCKLCGEKAEYIGIVFREPFENEYYCYECSEKVHDDEIVMLPVTNSHRMGRCGYAGEFDDF